MSGNLKEANEWRQRVLFKILDNRQTTFLIQTYRVTILKQFTTRPLLTGSSRAQANIF